MPVSKGKSLADRKRRWGLLVDNRKRILAELPHLAGDLEDLEAVEKEVAALLARQAQYISKTREITKKLRSLAKRGDNLRGRIGAGIRWKYGFTADGLVGFGFTPHRSKRRAEDEPGEVADLLAKRNRPLRKLSSKHRQRAPRRPPRGENRHARVGANKPQDLAR
jgi:hypothetical protein